jgi:transcriptional regulator with XRE-family HTH domain
MPKIDDIDAIAEAMRAQGKSQADLGRLLGLGSSQITRMFQGRRRVQVHELQTIQEWLNIGAPPAGDVLAAPGSMIPLYGWTDEQRHDRFQFVDEFMLGSVSAHPAQHHLRNAFAVRTPDDANWPRFEVGETLYAAPHQRPAPRGWCLVTTRQGLGLIRRFVRRSDEGLVLEQINPPQEMVVRADDVAAIHAIIGTSS